MLVRPLVPLLIALLSCSGVVADEAKRPNIILIISDDHTFTHYGFMGHEIVRTPHMDRMAREGLLYTRGYTLPVCSPSLATLLTGTMPRQHGITGNDLAPDSPQNPGAHDQRAPLLRHLLANPLMLPKALTQAGYLTFQTGKIWNAAYHELGFTHGMTKERSRHGGEGLKIGREGMDPIYEFIDTALEAQKPFFIWHAPFLPHDPHNPPERLLEKYTGKGPTVHAEVYYAMVEWLDETCGQLDQWLDQKGLKENTVILYLSDNGWDPHHGYKGGRAKLTPYENGIRTPMFVRWPGKLEPKRDDTNLASILDFPTTILELAGVAVPEHLEGLNLMDREAMAARNTIFIESYSHDMVDLDDPVKSLTARVVIDGWWKLILPGPHQEQKERAIPFSKIDPEIQLFDLKNDPFEKTNLAGKHPEVVQRLIALQDAEWKIK
jgi:arylsulfatase A-like enzyme